MNIEIGPSSTSKDEQKKEHKQDVPEVHVVEAWDMRGRRRWHEEMRNIGLRMLEEKIASPREVQDAPQPRSFWNLIPQAYEILRSTTYFRPQRRTSLFKENSRH